MKIRRASIEDAKGIAKVHIDSWQFCYKHIMEDDLLASLNLKSKVKTWESLLTKSDRPTYVAVNSKGSIEGFVILCAYRDDDLKNQNIGEIAAIYINPFILGTGVGALLFKEGLLQITNLGYSSIALWVLEKNQLGINFYKGFGFSPDGGKKIHPATGLVELRYVNSNYFYISYT